MTTQKPSRRDFIKTTATSVGTAAAITQTTASAAETSSANSKLRIGFIGPGRRGFGAHVKRLTKLQVEGRPIELVAVCDVYNEHRDRAAAYIEKETGKAPTKHEDYQEMFAKANLDAVCIGTPDHWHAKQTIDSLNEGLHVYCEKPMTKTAEEAVEVMRTWQSSGKVMQVGVQSTSLPVWNQVNQMLTAGKLGKVLDVPDRVLPQFGTRSVAVLQT